MAISSRYTRKGLTRALCSGVCLGAFGGAALAQSQGGLTAEPPLRLQTDYFGYAASVAGRVGYTDNINLAPDGFEEDEFIVSTVFSGGAITSTNRFTGIALADLDLSYLVDSGDFNVSQNVGATGTATVADNWLYVDVSGRTTRQLIGDNARFSRNVNAARGQQANVHSLSASPYLYHRMADQSAVSLRYRFSQVFVDDSESDFNVFSRNFLNDSTTHEAVASYDSGNRFQRVRFSLSAYGNDTTEDGSGVLPDFGYRQGAFEGSAQVALSRTFSLSGAVGYDEIETSDAASIFFDDDELSGVFWRAGFTARPNRRGFARIEYGQRYGDDFIDADLSYRVTQRLNFRAGANRSFRTRAQNINRQFRDTQLQTLQYADLLRQGEALSPRDVIGAANQYSSILGGSNAQTVGVGVVDSAYASLSANYGRTTATLGGFYSDSDFGFRAIETFTVRGSVSRRLSRRLTGYVGADFRRADTFVDAAVCEANPFVFGFDAFDPLFDPVVSCANLAASNGVTNTISGNIGASYQIFENVAAFADYSHAQRWSEVEFLEYGENTVFVGLRLDF
jgi:uncharacterized protein (PEP-CTERM system associated)